MIKEIKDDAEINIFFNILKMLEGLEIFGEYNLYIFIFIPRRS